jgi:hypothetical protein
LSGTALIDRFRKTHFVSPGAPQSPRRLTPAFLKDPS